MENVENTNGYKEKSLVDLGNIISDSDYELGHIGEIEDRAKSFREQSGKFFAADKMQEAEIYKSLAISLEKESVEKRAKWQTKRERRGFAFEELGKRDGNSIFVKEQVSV